jgi:ABC-type uncharacterized transport system involved in gliding motility auxiliary subunit
MPFAAGRSPLVRRLFASGNTAATIALLGALFLMINYVGYRRYGRFDLTKAKIATLSGRTVQILQGLAEPVSIVVFYQPQTPEGAPDPVYPLIRDLLTEYERHARQLRVEYVDPFRDRARAEQLAKQFAIDRSNLVIVQAGGRHKYLSDTDLAEYDFSSMQFGGALTVKAFKGEDALTSALLNVTQASAPLVWFTTGHGEKSLEAKDGAGLTELKTALEQQNFSVRAAALAEQAAIPPEVKLVVIAGPARRFTEPETALLRAYLGQGGRLLALIDPMTDPGLDGLLGPWGIALGADVVVDPAAKIPAVSAANLLVMSYSRHPIVEKMQTLLTLFPLARSVRPAQPPPPGLTVTPLAMTSPSGWGETATAAQLFTFDEGTDLKGPVSIAVAAERLPMPASGDPAELGGRGHAEAEGGGTTSTARLVVVGDSDFVINAQLANAGNRDLLFGAVHWLAGQEQLIGIGPKTIESIKLNLTAEQLRRVFWFSVLGMPLMVAATGAGVWYLRRA